MFSTNAQTEPLPFVPATTITFDVNLTLSFTIGKPIFSATAKTLFKPNDISVG